MQGLIAKELGSVAVVTRVTSGKTHQTILVCKLHWAEFSVNFSFPEFVRGGCGVHSPRDGQRLSLPVSLQATMVHFLFNQRL